MVPPSKKQRTSHPKLMIVFECVPPGLTAVHKLIVYREPNQELCETWFVRQMTFCLVFSSPSCCSRQYQVTAWQKVKGQEEVCSVDGDPDMDDFNDCDIVVLNQLDGKIGYMYLNGSTTCGLPEILTVDVERLFEFSSPKFGQKETISQYYNKTHITGVLMCIILVSIFTASPC